MATTTDNNVMSSLLDAQKAAVDTVLENTRKLTGNNTVVNDSMEKGSEWYKQWLDNQKNFLGQTTQKATEATEQVKAGASTIAEQYQNWFNTQQEAAKKMWETSAGFMQNAQQGAQANASNPMAAATQQWQNMMNQYNTWMQNMNTGNQFMNMFSNMQNNNPFNPQAFKGMQDNWTSMFSQWSEMLSNGMGDWSKNMQPGTTQDAYRNMLNTAEGFTRFTQMWAPMWKSISEKTFNMEQYKQMMNPAQYKEFMDKFFGFMPESSRNYFQQMTANFQEQLKNTGSQAFDGMNQIKSMFSNMMPASAGSDMFGQMLNGYNQMHEQFTSAASPITRMMTQNAHTRSAADWQDLAHRMMVYSIKNAELQYMVYQQGSKVMDTLAENVQNKIQHGENIESMMSLYQEWINISDKTFVQLFESDAYSAQMAEVSAMQLKLRKDMETQVEKMLAPLPIATRSELDELYKTIYDLKKEVRQMERMMEFEAPAASPATEAPSAAANSTTASAATGTAKTTTASKKK